MTELLQSLSKLASLMWKAFIGVILWLHPHVLFLFLASSLVRLRLVRAGLRESRRLLTWTARLFLHWRAAAFCVFYLWPLMLGTWWLLEILQSGGFK